MSRITNANIQSERISNPLEQKTEKGNKDIYRHKPMMKHLFTHTASLFRAALLLSVLTFTNVQQTQSQTAEQWAAMPNAFETIEDPNSVIGNGEYYYIQFYYNGPISYLTDRGLSKKAWTTDFLPSNNRLWTLESAGNGQLKLKCKNGNYLGFGRFEGQDRYGGVNNFNDAVTFTLQQNGDGYNLFDNDHDYDATHANCFLGRYQNNEWGDLPKIRVENSGRQNSRMRLVKLKSNAAYIIYYRQDGADNSDPSASTIRHYLTYSDVDATSTVMASAVTNGSLEGADASSFFFGDPDHNERLVASITDGAGNNGSRGIQITARGKDDPQDWDTQFFISADEVIPEGTTFHLEFDYRASRNATVPTQAHAEPGNYIDWAMLGALNFTTDWQTYSADIEVTHNMGYGRDDDKGNSFQTIAFNLWRERSTDPNTIYYFDNIKLTVPTSGSAVSSRRSIIPPDKPLYTLPTIAAYHQDGLWQLEEASADGKFYIKRYDSNEYLNCDLSDPYAAAFAVLGPKDETHGQYSLVDPVASRYTLVQNVQYQTAALSPDMFYHWNGYGADAEIDNQHGNVDFFFQLGQQLNSGDVVAGTGGVDFVRYANLTGYTTMIIKGTPGMVVRVLMNRQESNDGPLTERDLTIGNDGKVELDLTDIKNDAGYVHLNAIKIGWGNSGIINDVELVNQNQVNNSSPLYLNHSNGDGYPVMQRNDDAGNHWYAAFYPVEVPVPNKDDFFQVLVRWGDNMIDHAGGSSPLPTDVSDYDLWQLEMVDDYKHFRLKDPNGRYLKPGGTGVTEPNNPDGAETNTNEKFWTDFALTWYYVNPVAKEIIVDGYVVHKQSYLRQYADDQVIANQEGLRKQGLSRDIDSDWKNFNSNLDGFTQNTNHFEITHYLKKGNSKVIEFPTVLNRNNDHIYFQRFYHYDEIDTGAEGNGMDLANLKAHVSLDTRDDGDVQYFLYKNGMVTGQKLDWRTYDNGEYTDIPDGGMARNEQRRFNFTNSDGQRFTVGVDVSRYSDLEYLNSPDHLAGDLREPSLTMRYIFYMRDAKEMAKNLTACPEGGSKWLEEKTFHFGRTQVPYTKFKKVGYRGEFLPVRHVFSDYWVYDDPRLVDETHLASLGLSGDALNDFLDEHLVSAVNDNNGGKIEVEIEDDATHPTGIRLGGWNPNINLRGYDDEGNDADYKGFYFYDKIARNQKTLYGNSRFIVFRYPASGQVEVPENEPQEAKLNVYFNAGGTRYQLAQYTIIFDANMATRPWTEIKNGTTYANGINKVKGEARDPNKLRERAGKPIAKVSFDFPEKMVLPSGEENATYHFPQQGETIHNSGWGSFTPTAANNYTGTIANSSPIPLTFDHTNYSFDGDGCNWGSYALVTGKTTQWGNGKIILPADDKTYGYNLPADPGMKKAFLYIDASEQPGDICAMNFEGEFCPSDKLMCSGWISGSNRYDDDGEHRCPGSITITIKGEDINGNTKTIYRFCPGQIYELDNGYGDDGHGNAVAEENAAGVDGSGNDATHVVWQQFFFEFSTDQKYERYWLEVNNNCVSSNGGDFMLDNVEVYTIVPEVKPDINTPLCVSLNDDNEPVVDMRLLKLNVIFNKLKSSANVTSGKTKIGFVFLEKDVFLKKLWDLKHLESTYENIDFLALAIKEGRYLLDGSDSDYKTAFDAALLGNKSVWDSSTPSANMGASVMYFEWDTNFNAMPEYTFAKAVNKESATFRYTNDEGDWLVFNGNYPVLPWKTDTEYYIVPTNNHVTNFDEVYGIFDICSACSKASVFRIESPYTLIGLGASEDANDYMVCEGQIPTLVSDLKGYDFNGVEVPMKDINYDWWLGDKANGVLPTLETYHAQEKDGVRLDVALSTLRIYYPEVTSLDGIVSHAAVNSHPALTTDMVNYLRELVNAGQLVLHQKSISVPAEPASTEDPYFYLVACPIHDEQYDQSLNPHGPTSIINNGNLNGFDTSSFYTRYNNINTNATISGGVGVDDSRGISVTSAAAPSGDPQDWDSQFFIRANEVIPQGTTFHLEFDYKASGAATVSTQAHSEPGSYIDNQMLGNLSFSTEWQHFEQDITVTSRMANGTNNDKNNSFQTIAFNLWTTKEERTYYFDNVELTVDKNHYVAFFCDEPQGLRVKVGDKAPMLKTGFVPGENGFESYNYAGAGDAILSIRLAKKEQFETVQHGEPDASTIDMPTTDNAATTHFLWLPIRDALVQSGESSKVIQKSEDENIYLASTNDPTWDKEIYKSMKKGSLPIVGKIVQLNAIDVSKSGGTENDNNRLCVYFTSNFDVREGYSYTLSLPFQESPGENTCDGTLLINLKIVPDYEVWTGAAGNTDWNNDENWRRADGNTTTSTTVTTDGSARNNNELYRTNDLPSTSPLKDYDTNYMNYRTAKDRILRKGFAPLYCTHVLIKSNEWGDAPQLYDALAGKDVLDASPFPNLRDKDGWDGTVTDESEGTTATKATATSILRYDMQARHYELWEETYGALSNKGRAGDLIAEMYQVNSCDEIAFQPGAELLNAHLLNYNNAWVEYKLDMSRWYLLGSPLQGTIAGEWYAPTGLSDTPLQAKVTGSEYNSNGSAQQTTTYYEPVKFGDGYDRYSPAIYQRSWDKAKAVLYEVGATYATTDNPNDLALENGQLPGSAQQGAWNGVNWNDTGADPYLDRLGYKPLGNKKANVAMKGIWSNTYNDATVDYTKGGFSVMVMNHLKGDSNSKPAIIRLPKEDTMYDYYEFAQTGANNGGTDTDLEEVREELNRAKNRGRLKTDLILPSATQRAETGTAYNLLGSDAVYGYGDRTITKVPTRVRESGDIADDGLLPMTLQPFTETVSAGISNMGYYLVENPFPCGLDMEKFFAANTGLEKKYWLLTASGQHLVQKAADNNEWISPTEEVVTGEEPNTETTYHFTAANGVLAPGQGFFVQATTPGEATTITFNADMQAQTRYGEPDEGTKYSIVVGTKQVMTIVPAVDEEGNPLIDEQGDTIKVETPQLDGQGNPVVEDIIDTVIVYKYKQKTGDGYEFPLKARRTRGSEYSTIPGLVITAQRGSDKSSALVMQRESASDDFLPSEDTETFISMEELKNIPTVYTLCGRLATTINSIHEFRCLPLGVESNSDAPCTLTFNGVELLGDSIAFYDAKEQKLTPLESGMQFKVSGQTQNRYYLVNTLIKEEAAAETHLQIFVKGLTANVIASTDKPIENVRCYDTAGRLVHAASPQSPMYNFTLPAAGVYIIEAETADDHKTMKVMAK